MSQDKWMNESMYLKIFIVMWMIGFIGIALLLSRIRSAWALHSKRSKQDILIWSKRRVNRGLLLGRYAARPLTEILRLRAHRAAGT